MELRQPDPTKPHREQAEDILLGMLAWGEARGESWQGKLAVCHTVRNRLQLAPRYGTGWRGVMLRAWQYSCFNAHDPNRNRSLRPVKYGSEAIWRECLQAAEDVYGGAPDITGGSTHYHATSIPKPKWVPGLVLNCKIGQHLFYGFEL